MICASLYDTDIFCEETYVVLFLFLSYCSCFIENKHCFEANYSFIFFCIYVLPSKLIHSIQELQD
jgi:hypothetical protein